MNPSISGVIQQEKTDRGHLSVSGVSCSNQRGGGVTGGTVKEMPLDRGDGGITLWGQLFVGCTLINQIEYVSVCLATVKCQADLAGTGSTVPLGTPTGALFESA